MNTDCALTMEGRKDRDSITWMLAHPSLEVRLDLKSNYLISQEKQNRF